MAAEGLTAVGILKWAWAGIFVPILGWLMLKHKESDKAHSKASDRLTILETKGEQTKEALDNNTAATKELTGLITQLRIDLATMNSTRDH